MGEGGTSEGGRKGEMEHVRNREQRGERAREEEGVNNEGGRRVGKRWSKGRE